MQQITRHTPRVNFIERNKNLVSKNAKANAGRANELTKCIKITGKKRSSAAASGPIRNRKLGCDESEYQPSDFDDDYEDRSAATYITKDYVTQPQNKRQKIEITQNKYNEKPGFISNLFDKVKTSFSDAITAGFTSHAAEMDQPLTLLGQKSSSFEERATIEPVMSRSLEQAKPKQKIPSVAKHYSYDDQFWAQADRYNQIVPDFNHLESDFIELEIQKLSAHTNLQGDFINNGQIEQKDEIARRAKLGQVGGVQLQFTVYQENDLPFLDKSTKIGNQISKSIVQAEFDDDCATDDDMKDNAIRILQRDLKSSIEKFQNDKKLVKNLNLHKRFHSKKVWEDSDNE